MKAGLLHLDDALLAQTELVARADSGAIDARALGPALRLWARAGAMHELRKLLGAAPRRPAELIFSGSGDFHHLTCLLVARAAEAAGAPITVLHFDNHPDWVEFDSGVHCGSWAARAARMKGVDRLITVGPCSADIVQPRAKSADIRPIESGQLELYPHRAPGGGAEIEVCGRRWASVESMGRQAFDEFLLTRIRTPSVYITIDKDVLRPGDAITNWDQGETRLEDLLQTLARVACAHKVVGADIVGDWSAPVYGGGAVATLLKRGEAWLDQPWRRPPPREARRVNEGANLRLLDFFSEVA